jgi:SAM-dependent methyltransferase
MTLSPAVVINACKGLCQMNLDTLRKGLLVKNLYTEYQFPNHPPANDILLSIVRQAMPFYSKYIRPGMRVLDAGCGTGNYAAAFATLFPQAEFTGIDFSEKSLQRAREMFGHLPNLRFAQHDLLTPYPAETPFSAIISLGVIHHLEDQVRGLNNIGQILSDDGALLLHLYGKHGLYEKNIVRTIVMHMAYDLDWPERFQFLDCLKQDERLKYFQRPKPKSRYWFIPGPVRRSLRALLGHSPPSDEPPRSSEADSFFHPIETHHTIETILALLDQSGLKFVELNEYHPGCLRLPDQPFRDPYLNQRYANLPHLDRMIIAENLLRPACYAFAASKK